MAEPTLTWEITDIKPDHQHARKLVAVDWTWVHEHGRTRVVQDNLHVPPDATNEQILVLVERRKRNVEVSHPYVVPDVSINDGLVGLSG